MDNFTFEDYTEFLNNEKRFIESLRNTLNISLLKASALKEESVETILGYSKSMSVKASKKIGSVKIMLN